jgi:hypothetical protein
MMQSSSQTEKQGGHNDVLELCQTSHKQCFQVPKIQNHEGCALQRCDLAKLTLL